MLDIVPTILPEVLGCTNPINEYSAGLNLFSQDLKKGNLFTLATILKMLL